MGSSIRKLIQGWQPYKNHPKMQKTSRLMVSTSVR